MVPCFCYQGNVLKCSVPHFRCSWSMYSEQASRKRWEISVIFFTSIKLLLETPFSPTYKLRNLYVVCAVSSTKRHARLSKILINSSFPYSYIHVKSKPFPSAQFSMWEFYLESLRCCMHCTCLILTV